MVAMEVAVAMVEAVATVVAVAIIVLVVEVTEVVVAMAVVEVAIAVVEVAIAVVEVAIAVVATTTIISNSREAHSIHQSSSHLEDQSLKKAFKIIHLLLFQNLNSRIIVMVSNKHSLLM